MGRSLLVHNLEGKGRLPMVINPIYRHLSDIRDTCRKEVRQKRKENQNLTQNTEIHELTIVTIGVHSQGTD